MRHQMKRNAKHVACKTGTFNTRRPAPVLAFLDVPAPYAWTSGVNHYHAVTGHGVRITYARSRTLAVA